MNDASSDHGRLLDLAEAMSGVGRWRLEVETGQVAWSDEVYRIHGVDPQTFNPNLGGAVGFYHPEDRVAVEALVDAAVARGDPFAFQRRLIRPDGEVRHVICKADSEHSADGAVLAVVGVMQDVTDQVLDVERIRRSETKYRLLADNMGDVLARIRLDGSRGYVSPTIEALLGYRPEEMADRPLVDFVHAEDRPALLSILAAMADGLETKTLQYRAVHKNGRLVWVETRLTLLKSAAGRASEIILVVRDISDRKAAAAALAASEARYRLLTENATDLIVELDPLVRFVYASPSLRRMLDYDAGFIVGRHLKELVHPEDLSVAEAAVSAVMSGSAPRVEYRLLHRNGAAVWVESRPMLVRDPSTGEVVGVTDILRDVSERKAGEAALAASEARYRELADNASDMIAHMKLDGVVTFVSQGCFSTLGYTPEELIGRRTLDLMHPADVAGVEAFYVDLFKQGPNAPSRTFEFRAYHKSGRCVWLEGRPKVFFDAVSRAPVGIQDVARDITSRKELELELECARRDAEAAALVKSEFLSNMSHELRTPLTSILGFSSILSEEGDLSGRGRRAVERVRSSSQALLALVDDILDFSKLESGQIDVDRRLVSPAALLRDCLELLEPQAQLKALDLSLGDVAGLPPFLALDEGRLRQILVNLIGNGIKFTAAGHVSVQAAYDEDSGRLRCEVVDTGMGIASDRLDRLFKRFSQVDGSTTRAYGGTGLGLAICKGLAEAMGGEIGVSSVVGEGARFWFEIPCDDAQAPPAPGPQPPAISGYEALSGLRLLLADERAANRQRLRLLLGPYGVDILEATTVEEAATFADGAPFDLIMMDGAALTTRGYAFVRDLRDGGGPNDLTPLIGLLDGSMGAAAEAAGEGVDGWLSSPVVPEDLLEAVSRWAAPYTPQADGERTYG